MTGLTIQASLQIGPIGRAALEGSQQGADFQSCLRAHHHHHCQGNQQGQQPGQIGQNMMQTGQQMVQEGQRLIQQGDYQQGRQLINQGASLEQQGAQLQQQGQGIDPCNQMPTSNSQCVSSNPINGQNCHQSDCQQPGEIGQNLIQTGQQLVQQGQRLIQQGDYQQGMMLINQGANLEQQGAQCGQQQAAQGTDPFNQYASDALCSNNNGRSAGPLGQLLSQLSQQIGQIENGMGMTSLLSGGGMTSLLSSGSLLTALCA